MIYIISKFQCRLIHTLEHLKCLVKEIEIGFEYVVNITNHISSGFQKVIQILSIS